MMRYDPPPILSSPYVAHGTSVSRIMFLVLAALVPGIVVYVATFGGAVLVSILLASITALVCEIAMLRLRRYPVQPFLADGSALLTAWLLALTIPPLTPWWLPVVGTAFAIIVAKHLYGGLGNNPFNPAMVGFAVLMISFPAFMTSWPAPLVLAKAHLTFEQEILYMFTGHLPGALTIDAINMATPLDALKTQLKQEFTVSQVLAQPIYTFIGGKGTLFVAMAYLAGGLFLLWKRIITWHVPVSFLVGLVSVATIFTLVDPQHYTSPWFHLATGGTMLGAFFIATDPVSGATTPLGKVIFGALIGMLTYLIRVLGGYPDGVAFAVLIMNAMVPLIDAYTQPRAFGHAGRRGKA